MPNSMGEKKKKYFNYLVLIIILESVPTTKGNIATRVICDTQIHNIHLYETV